ncbi:RTA1 like protein-domain-containing protein [Aspergillus pseudocaelatus]|uniref:RTA1 like protein-domain-containing protein n=1 Tax=Aspergillus pseudocaelatus TaxID=1825620 RepID=A0ABQ6X4A8_9EURO|nr:RTA1 like protein-domain-containing protein [Aspergillus pseudocaelatus]
MQVIFFGLFLFCAAFFHFRIRRHIATHKPSYATPWQSHLLVLYIASVMVFVRSSFRLAEYVGGQGDVLLQHEYYIWIFDTTLMSLTMLLFNVFYPLTVREGDMSLRGVFLRDLSEDCPKSDVSLKPIRENPIIRHCWLKVVELEIVM